MNLSTLQPTPRNLVQWSSTLAEGKEASFLSFNYINKHARVRISPIPLDLSSFEGKCDFLAVANTQGWFAAITRSSDGQTNLVCSPLSQLHAAFATDAGAGVDEINFTPQRTLTISPATPNILTLASNETRLLIGSIQGPIAVYDCSQLFSQGMNDVGPIHTFSGSAPCEQIVPNPGDIPELVAVLRRGDHPSVEMLNLQNHQLVGGWASGGTSETTPSSLSWSPRGKQLAIGLHNGDIATFSPTSMDSPKAIILKPPSAGDSRVLSTTWLANPTFHVIYGPPGPVSPKMSQAHYVVNFDTKSNSAADISLSSPCYPFPGLRPPGSFVLVLRNWDPVKFLLFVGDSTSSDIGSIGCFVDSSGESWNNLSLDEACIPSLPLDKNLEDTVLLGLELDLTAKDAYDHTTVSGEKLEVPAPPIVYAYCSDGTVLAWHVVNANGAPYPGMINISTSSSTLDAPMSMTPSTSNTVETKASSPTTAFGSAQSSTIGFGSFTQTSQQPAFGQSGFGQPPQSPPSTFGSSQPSSSGFGAFAQGGNQPFGKPQFGQTSFGQSSFGQSAFGQPSQHSVFSKPSGFSQPSFGDSPFGKAPANTFGSVAPSSGGFSSYASATPAGFGQSSSAFATSSLPTTSSQTETKAPELTREISMSVEPQESELGGLSLGSDSVTGAGTGKTAERGTTGLFGQSASSPSTSSFSSSGFGTTVLNPGFGAFSNWGPTKNETSTIPATTSPDFQKPTPSAVFGQSGFGVQASGQSGFGATKSAMPTFGQSSFGKSPLFGQSSFGTKPSAPSAFTSSATSGGFGAYANASVSLSSVPPSGAPTKSIWAVTTDEPPSSEPPSKHVTSQPATPEKPLPLPTASESESGSKETDKLASPAPESSEDEISFRASSEEDEGDHAEDNFTSDTGSESYADESLSYEDFSAQLTEEQEIEGPHELSPVQEETSLHDESDAENVTSVQETLIKEDPPDPTKIPLPISRSSSAHTADASPAQTLPGSREVSPLDPAEIVLRPTPKDSTISSPEDTPRSKGTKLPSPPSPVDQLVEQPPILKSQEPTTTTPSSPAKLAPALPSPAPTPPFGRPSARPIRSSPLAGTPINVGDESLPVASPSPSLLKPRPASPKSTFGQLVSPTTEGKKPARPKTPPLTVIGPPPPTKPLVLPPLSFPAAQPIPPLFLQASPSILGKETSPVVAVHSSSFFSPGQTLQSAKVDLQTTPGSPASGISLGQKMTSPGLASTPSSIPPSFTAGNIFNQRTPQTPSPIAAPPISPSHPPKTHVSTLPIPEPSLQDGMQAECAYLFMSMNKELEDLKLLAEVVNRKRQNLIKAKPVMGTKADLGDPKKWSMADISAHGRSMKQLEQDVLGFKDMQGLFRKSIDTVESDMLKATTRKEEIVRFSKATSNAEFAKMLKSRTLGPEHLETQTKLRRQLRTIRDRVEKLEGILQASKKKLNRQKSGKVGFRAPSLDTINRTYRNIDLAIAQQAENVSKLSSRVVKLDLKSLGKASSRDKRLPDKKSRKLNVTPSVAATTAAALNAERSAYKLKQVLLSVRDKPLLNDKAAHTSPSRVDFKTPQKLGDGWSGSNWQIPDTVSPAHSPSYGREAESPSVGSRRGAGSKHHQKSAPLKKQQVSTSPTPVVPAKFDWGPPPSIGLKTNPPASLPFSIR